MQEHVIATQCHIAATSVDEIAQFCGCKPKRVREVARELGLRPIDSNFDIILKPFATLILQELGVDQAQANQWVEQKITRHEASPGKGPVSDRHDIDHEVRSFTLPPDEPRTHRRLRYVDHLVTSKEKAGYYQDMLKNGGDEDSHRIVADCRRRLTGLRERYNDLKAQRELSDLEQRLLLEEIQDLEEHIEVRTPNDLGEKLFEFHMPIQKLRALVAFWRSFNDFVVPSFFQSPLESVSAEEIWLATAMSNELGVQALRNQAQREAEVLLQLVKQGNSRAAFEFATLVVELVGTLNLFARKELYQPAFKTAARQMTRWPVLYSHHKKLRDDGKLIKDLALGKDYKLNVDDTPRWDPQDYLTQVASDLYEHLCEVRKYPDANGHFEYAVDAKKLPAITEAGAPSKWWNLAERVFLQNYPEPEKEPSLNVRVRGTANRKFPSKIREKILEYLHARFDSLIGKKSHDKRFKYTRA